VVRLFPFQEFSRQDLFLEIITVFSAGRHRAL
jgi:hypothetical protein